jgi:hypothetical protein
MGTSSEKTIKFIKEYHVRRACLRMYDDGSGIIICRKRHISEKFYRKGEAIHCLGLLKEENYIYEEEYWEVKGQIENSKLSD